MNKQDLMEALSKDTGLSVTKAAEVVNVFFDEMTDALVKGDRVEIRGLGSFKVKHYDGYTGRNPKTEWSYTFESGNTYNSDGTWSYKLGGQDGVVTIRQERGYDND